MLNVKVCEILKSQTWARSKGVFKDVPWSTGHANFDIRARKGLDELNELDLLRIITIKLIKPINEEEDLPRLRCLLYKEFERREKFYQSLTNQLAL